MHYSSNQVHQHTPSNQQKGRIILRFFQLRMSFDPPPWNRVIVFYDREKTNSRSSERNIKNDDRIYVLENVFFFSLVSKLQLIILFNLFVALYRQQSNLSPTPRISLPAVGIDCRPKNHIYTLCERQFMT